MSQLSEKKLARKQQRVVIEGEVYPATFYHDIFHRKEVVEPKNGQEAYMLRSNGDKLYRYNADRDFWHLPGENLSNVIEKKIDFFELCPAGDGLVETSSPG